MFPLLSGLGGLFTTFAAMILIAIDSYDRKKKQEKIRLRYRKYRRNK